MFYKMIEAKRNEWLTSPECTIQPLIAYMEKQGQMRDAQIEAIKTYLFLKIVGACKPLSDLFSEGVFNNISLDDIPLSAHAREYLTDHPEAAALFTYSRWQDDTGNPVSSAVEAAITTAPDTIDYKRFFREIFYGVSYSDYLFSLPMGAGKTYLMAAFIYLDLYFARNEPDNPAFAHNFIIFAPSGLKSSVVPSLKTIQNFDPTWILPEPAASEIKRLISFEVLDQGKTAKDSNKTKNPNVQKIANHQPLSELFGLVAVTNAEKVILDRVEEQYGQITFDDKSTDVRDRQANELRNLIGKLPFLSVFIDEVHHAVSSTDKKAERKLRAVVSRWTDTGSINSVIGFSGTPYLEKAEAVKVTDTLSISTAEITNIVYYYPLVEGVGNFLKRPVIKIEDIADSSRIIENGVRLFLDTYKDKIYSDGTTAKLGIYCGLIAKLEELVYPLVCGIVREYGLDQSCILRFYRESSSKDKTKKKYTAPADSQMLFDTLDKAFSPIRIVLLAQIGKEGWDCRSLTGVILSQEGDCPKNMVLQTSCRCLRQVEKGVPETALIYLNTQNAETLNAELQRQHRITLEDFKAGGKQRTELKRYDRTAYLKLPKIDFYQLKVDYETLTVEDAAPAQHIPQAAETARIQQGTIRTTDLEMAHYTTEFDDPERGAEPASFSAWLYDIAKASFGTLTMEALNKQQESLRQVFDAITYRRDDRTFFSSKYNQAEVRANIRKAFCERRGYSSRQELIPETAALLNIANFTPTVSAKEPDDYYPSQEIVERIIQDDAGKLKMSPRDQELINLAESGGYADIVRQIKAKYASHSQKDRSFHYLPYHTDSTLEKDFLASVLSLADLETLGLECYYNGERAMTEFRIKCYRQQDTRWTYIGMYTPDFLIIQRRDGRIHKAIIVETKGAGYEARFQEKKTFMETAFLQQNNAKFGYERFDFLYLPDTLTEAERLSRTHEKICGFFGEG